MIEEGKEEEDEDAIMSSENEISTRCSTAESSIS